VVASGYVSNGDCELAVPKVGGQFIDERYATSALSTEQAYSGTNSVKVTCALQGASYSSTVYEIGLTPNTVYQVKVWVYLPSSQANLNKITLASADANFGNENIAEDSTELTDQ
tara:strand:+ start:210 stop:551 length:342 start_codon:yes stop_codon:yes gene_type:complete